MPNKSVVETAITLVETAEKQARPDIVAELLVQNGIVSAVGRDAGADGSHRIGQETLGGRRGRPGSQPQARGPGENKPGRPGRLRAVRQCYLCFPRWRLG